MYHSFFNPLLGLAVSHADLAVSHAGLAIDGMFVAILHRQTVTKASQCSLSITACALIDTHTSQAAVAHLHQASGLPWLSVMPRL